MKDLVEASVDILQNFVGLEIPRSWMPYLIFAVTVGPILTWLYLLIRRWRGDFRAISGDMQAAVDVISHDTKKELGGLLKKFEALHEDLKGSIVGRLEALQMLLKSTDEVTSQAADDSIEQDKSPAAPSRQTRLWMAEQVRNAVVSKWLDGRHLTQVEPNCFRYAGKTETGNEVNLYFQTPYRNTVTSDGRLPFTLDVWVNGYKHLNFEWDSEGKYALRGFKRGEWISELAEWQFLVGQSQQQAA